MLVCLPDENLVLVLSLLAAILQRDGSLRITDEEYEAACAKHPDCEMEITIERQPNGGGIALTLRPMPPQVVVAPPSPELH